MAACPLVWIIIGVSGSEKTVVGRLLSERLECDFLEGDRRHPSANINKMLSYTPLEDEDRRQWLFNIEEDIQWAKKHQREVVITCSCLKAAYRNQLASLGQVQLVWIRVPEEELATRMATREHHFMKPEMLMSQLAAFEPIGGDEHVMVVDGGLTPHEVVDELMRQATQMFPDLKTSWWQRYRI